MAGLFMDVFFGAIVFFLKKNRKYLNILFIFLVCFLLPSLKLGIFKRVSLPIDVVKNVNPGEWLIFPFLKQVKSPNLGGKDLSWDDRYKFYFGTLGTGLIEGMRLRGLWLPYKEKNSDSFIFHNVFVGKTQYWFNEPIKMNFDSNLKKIKLRIPTSVQQKIIKNKQRDQEQITRRRMRHLMTLESDWNFSTKWIYPLESKIVSPFGHLRVLPSGKVYLHSGIDFRAPVGTPVRSTSDGHVVMTGEMAVLGRFVLIDHGRGIFTRYLHLNEILVKEPDAVNMGQIIARSGQSGRITGPHLHWEILWKGRELHPSDFLDFWESNDHLK